MKVFIMAGGKGTRIASVAGSLPKPMIPICGKPILEYQVNCLKSQGLCDIIISVGHLGEVIKNYFGNGTEFGVSIKYIEEKEPLGTAGSLYYIKDQQKDDFILINGDIIFDVNFSKIVEYHKRKSANATLFTHPNDHPYDSGIIITNNDGRVVNWLHKEDKIKYYKNRVNAGIHVLSPHVPNSMTELCKRDLDRDILTPLVKQGKVYAYDSPEYVKDMGTPDRYRLVEADMTKGIISAKNLNNKQKACFIDRDGTINKHNGFICKPGEIELLPNSAEAIRVINKMGYLAILITNQPVIARGDCSFGEMEEIHNCLETLLGKEGAYLDGILYCPHHPDKGFDGERTEYKIQCDCRKPNPGLIFEAARKYNIDLSRSYMIGDSMSDVEAGLAAGCRAVKIGDGEPSEKENFSRYNDLIEFVSKEVIV